MSSLLDICPDDVLVEGSRKVTLHQLVIVNCLGYNPPNKLKVAEMVTVAVRRLVDGVGDAIARGRAEQGVHGVEDLTGDNDVPLTEKTTCILTILT